MNKTLYIVFFKSMYYHKYLIGVGAVGRGYTVQKHSGKANGKAHKNRQKAASGIQPPELFQVMPEGLGIAREIGAWVSSLSSFPGTVKAPECGM